MGCPEGEGFVQLSPPLILVNVDQIDFGEVPVGFQVTRRFTITNGGDIDLNISTVRVEGDQVFEFSPDVMLIEPGTDAEISLVFAPAGAAQYTGGLIIDSDASNAAMKQVTLTGVGVDAVSCGNCMSPPGPSCLSFDDSVSYSETGTCVMDECEYTAVVTACPDGCNETTGLCRGAAPDAGVVDTGVEPDAGVIDTGVADTGVVDTGVEPDAGVVDTGVVDTGVPPDTGVVDTGVPPDTGVVPDAGPQCADAGTADSGFGAPSVVFTTPGAFTATLPGNVTTVTVRAWGGGGQGGNQDGATGGGGAFVQAQLTVTAGETLNVLVAEGGTPNGLGDGAGASYIRRGTTDLLVAGGGGGGGSDGNSGRSMAGGAGGGGGPVGQSGANGIGTIATYCTQVTGGTGGTATTGGVGGTNQGIAANRCDGQPGARNTGGRASGVNGNCDTRPGAEEWRAGGGQSNGGGGGGGAGYFGGGGSGFIWTYCGAGGGGGASWVDPMAAGVVHEGGQGALQGRAAESNGAGRGGERCLGRQGDPGCICNNGESGRVELYY